MNNAVYGQTMENVRNRINVELARNKKDHLKWAFKTSYILQKIFDNNLVAIRKNKVTLMLNKPAYIGICILELCKVLRYDFHYDCIKNKYGKRILKDYYSQTLIV